MPTSCRLARFLLPLTAASLLHCDSGPPASLITAPATDGQLGCKRGNVGTIVTVVCDLARAPTAYEAFVRGELVPERELALRHYSPLQFSASDVPAQARLLSQLRRSGSFMSPFNDVAGKHDSAGWLLFDRARNLSMMLVAVDRRIGTILSEFPASSPENMLRLFASIEDAHDLSAWVDALGAYVDFAIPSQ